MSKTVEIFKLLESANRKNIHKGLELLKAYPQYTSEAENRYIHFIRARLNNPTATIFDFEQAALSKEDLAIFNDKSYIDSYSISLQYMDNKQTKLMVDTIGSVFAILMDIESFKNFAKHLTEENYSNKLYDFYYKEVPQKIKSFFQQHKQSYGWYSKIIKKILSLDQLSKFYLNHTHFEDANNSLMMEYFTWGLLLMNRSAAQLHVDVAQSNFPKFSDVFWTTIMSIRVSTVDAKPDLPYSFMSFVREAEVREDDSAPYLKVASRFRPPVVNDQWLAARPELKELLLKEQLTVASINQAGLNIQKKIILTLLETTDIEVFRLGLSVLDQNKELADFANDHYKDLLKAHNSSKYIGQLFEPIAQLLKGNTSKEFGSEEHSTIDVKYYNALPDSLCKRLRYMSLDKKLALRLTAPLEKFSKVEVLIMQAPKLTDKVIPEAFANWNNLKEVQLTKAKITQVPSWIINWNSLKKLSLEGNQLTDLPEELNQLEELETLCLASNKFTTFPKVLTQNQTLQSLDLSNTKITNIPLELKNLGKLRKLHLAKCKKIKDFSPVFELQNLQELYLEYSGIKNIPTTIGQLSQLKKLDLEQGDFEELPKEIGLLTQLKELHINGCKKLITLPPEIGKLHELRFINLSFSHFSDYRATLLLLPTQIEILDLNSSLLEEWPEEISRFTNLKVINLDNTSLTQIPKTIETLTQLQELRVSNTKLSEVPKEVSNLTNLKLLHLMENQLKELPEEIGNLTNVKEIAVRNNQIKTIPSSIANLKNLENLYLQHNAIEDIPEELSQLTQLKNLYIENNPIVKNKKKLKQLEKMLPNNCSIFY